MALLASIRGGAFTLAAVLSAAGPHAACDVFLEDPRADAGTSDGEDGGVSPDMEVPPPVRPVDLLLVIDNSAGMTAMQNAFAGEMPDFLRALLHPERDPVSGVVPPAVDDLHVGVISTDMGSGGHSIVGCSDPDVGDDGVLQNTGTITGCHTDYSAAGCEATTCPWLLHSREHPDDDPSNEPIWEDLACIATLGVEGCGFERPLESAFHALVDQSVAGMPNHGFLRPGSLLVIVILTNEDDCSASSPDFFDPTRDELGSGNTRCAMHPEEMYLLDRYLNALHTVRGPGKKFVAVIAGIPADGRWVPGDPIDGLRDMVKVDPENPDEMVPSCSNDLGDAMPPVRLAELAGMLGIDGYITSVCADDWKPAFGTITLRIRERISVD